MDETPQEPEQPPSQFQDRMNVTDRLRFRVCVPEGEEDKIRVEGFEEDQDAR